MKAGYKVRSMGGAKVGQCDFNTQGLLRCHSYQHPLAKGAITLRC